jgi:hypothetical protein
MNLRVTLAVTQSHRQARRPQEAQVNGFKRPGFEVLLLLSAIGMARPGFLGSGTDIAFTRTCLAWPWATELHEWYECRN